MSAPAAVRTSPVSSEPLWLRITLIGIALLFMGLFLLVPLFSIFYEAFRQGMVVYWAAITEPDALSAIKLTLLAAAIALPLNAIFGIAAAWAHTHCLAANELEWEHIPAAERSYVSEKE